MNKALRIWFVFVLSGFIGGCAIGFDHTLFMTKSNIGVDIDTKPPTAEISVARREIVIAPTFEGGQTPPVHASFSTGNRKLFGFDVSSVFAGGDAAATVSEKAIDVEKDSEICLSERPIGRPYLLGLIPLGTYELPKRSEIRPFVFGTDTTFGVKVAWSGMTAQFPDSLKIGFNRKEMALSPVILKEENAVSENCTKKNMKFSAEMPAFLATIRVASEFASPESQDAKYRQSFSTGTAATRLAQDEYVKELIWSMLDRAPEPIVVTYGPDDHSACIGRWLESDVAQKDKKRNEINNWLKNKGHTIKSTSFITSKEFSNERIQLIKEKELNCKGGE